MQEGVVEWLRRKGEKVGNWQISPLGAVLAISFGKCAIVILFAYPSRDVVGSLLLRRVFLLHSYLLKGTASGNISMWEKMNNGRMQEYVTKGPSSGSWKIKERELVLPPLSLSGEYGFTLLPSSSDEHGCERVSQE